MGITTFDHFVDLALAGDEPHRLMLGVGDSPAWVPMMPQQLAQAATGRSRATRGGHSRRAGRARLRPCRPHGPASTARTIRSRSSPLRIGRRTRRSRTPTAHRYHHRHAARQRAARCVTRRSPRRRRAHHEGHLEHTPRVAVSEHAYDIQHSHEHAKGAGPMNAMMSQGAASEKQCQSDSANSRT